jgi:hypothetical protein
MSQVNDAYARLRGDPDTRTTARSSGKRARSNEPPVHAPTPVQCMFCGCEPARDFSFGYQHSFLLWFKRFSLGGVLCRECARSVGRSAQSRTLATGWWGIKALFFNFGLVFQNFLELNRARTMDRATRRDPLVLAPLPAPLPHGRPVFTRLGFLFLVALAAIGSIAAASSGADSQSPGGSADSGWSTAVCFAGGPTLGHPVDCAEPNSGRVVGVVGSSSFCPSSADSYVVHDLSTYCITSTSN